MALRHEQGGFTTIHSDLVFSLLEGIVQTGQEISNVNVSMRACDFDQVSPPRNIAATTPPDTCPSDKED
jgi:hypothetical protein